MGSKLTSIFLLAIAAIIILPQKGDDRNYSILENKLVNHPFIRFAKRIPEHFNKPIQSIDTREPIQYSATVEFFEENFEGEKIPETPALTISFTRENENYQLKFSSLSNDVIVFLKFIDKEYLILPNKREYAEIKYIQNQLEPFHLLIPENIIKYLKRGGNYKKINEEEFKGRIVFKYLKPELKSSKISNCQAGSENLIYVDKETKLPLRIEFTPLGLEASPHYLCGSRFIIEMREVETKTKKQLFVLPQNYQKISENKAVSQIKAEMNIINKLSTGFPNY